MKSEPRIADLFVQRALGAPVRTLAARFAMSEPDVRALLDRFGEPARLQPRLWRVEGQGAQRQLETHRLGGTYAAVTHNRLTRSER